MSLTFALDLLRELRWAWPVQCSSSGLSLPLVLLLLILACCLGCICGGLVVLTALSASCRRVLSWLISGCAAALVDPLPQGDTLRRRLGQYRAVHGA